MLAGSRALWFTYVGGNIREYSLWTATTRRTKPRLVLSISRDVDARAPIILGAGDSSRFGYILPYAVDSRVYGLRPDGRQAFRWVGQAHVVALAAKGGELAVALETGEIYVLDARGRELRRYGTDPVGAVAVTGNAVVAQRGRSLIQALSTDDYRTWRMAAGARLADADGRRVLYVAGSSVHVLRLDTGSDRIVHRTSARALAQLEGSTLVVADARRVSASTLR
jgi:hypothetical protein